MFCAVVAGFLGITAVVLPFRFYPIVREGFAGLVVASDLPQQELLLVGADALIIFFIFSIFFPIIQKPVYWAAGRLLDTWRKDLADENNKSYITDQTVFMLHVVVDIGRFLCARVIFSTLS